MISAVVLDVDDTVYLERDYVRSGFVAVGAWAEATHGVAGVADEAWQLFLGGGRGRTLTDALDRCGVTVTETVREMAIATYRSHLPSIEPVPDAATFISRLEGPWGVVTDGPAISQRAKCAALGLDRAAALVITDELGTSKPDPLCFETVERLLQLSGPDLVYVADNPHKDFQGPLERGWHVLRVRRPLSLHDEVDTPAGIPEVPNLAAAISSESASEAALTELMARLRHERSL